MNSSACISSFIFLRTIITVPQQPWTNLGRPILKRTVSVLCCISIISRNVSHITLLGSVFDRETHGLLLRFSSPLCSDSCLS